MIKYYIKAFEADSYEDSYLKGEKSCPDSSWYLTDLHLNTRPAFDSPDEVLKYILNKNCFDEKNMKYWSRDDINAAAARPAFNGCRRAYEYFIKAGLTPADLNNILEILDNAE